MALTVRDGQLRTKGTNAVNPDQLAPDVQDRIYNYDAGSTPLNSVLMKRGRVVPAHQTEVKHLEGQTIPDWDKDSGSGATNSATTVNVLNGQYHRVGEVLLNPATGEGMLITAIATNALTVTRGYTGTAAAIAASQSLINLGAPEAEGADAPIARATVPVTLSNYTQIKRTPVSLSRTLAQVNTVGGKERDRLRRNAGIEHARDWENILLHGTKKEDTSSGIPVRLAGGLDSYVQTNILDASAISSGAIVETDINKWLAQVFRYRVDGGGGRKVLVVGTNMMSRMSSWGIGKLQTQAGASKMLGFEVSTYVSPYGPLDVVYHPLLTDGYADRAYVVDMAGIMIRPLQRTILRTDIGNKTTDGYQDEYLTEQTFSFINEKAFGIIKGIAA